MATLFVAAGVNHFRDPAFYDPMIPSVLPAPRFWVLFTGAAEVLGGVGLLVPWLRRAAGCGLSVMLVGFLWVHVAMVVEPPVWDGRPLPRWAMVVRLVMQGPLIAWVWWAAARPSRPVRGAAPASPERK